jgi:hypothetical protein
MTWCLERPRNKYEILKIACFETQFRNGSTYNKVSEVLPHENICWVATENVGIAASIIVVYHNHNHHLHYYYYYHHHHHY